MAAGLMRKTRTRFGEDLGAVVRKRQQSAAGTDATGVGRYRHHQVPSAVAATVSSGRNRLSSAWARQPEQNRAGRPETEQTHCGAYRQPRQHVVGVVGADVHAGERHRRRSEYGHVPESAVHQPKTRGDGAGKHGMIGRERWIGAAVGQHEDVRQHRVGARLGDHGERRWARWQRWRSTSPWWPPTSCGSIGQDHPVGNPRSHVSAIQPHAYRLIHTPRGYGRRLIHTSRGYGRRSVRVQRSASAPVAEQVVGDAALSGVRARMSVRARASCCRPARGRVPSS